MTRFSPPRFLRVCMVLAFSLCLVLSAQAQELKAKYVILFIGDGMGQPQRSVAEYYFSRMETPEGQLFQLKRLLMNTFPVQGSASTFSTNALITDSAAAGTAISTGCKTDNGVVCVDPKTKAPLTTIAELAKKAGLKVAIITSTPIDDATPACFYAHQGLRSNSYDITVQLGKSGFDFFAGGAAGGAGETARKAIGALLPSPVDLAREYGYVIASTPQALANLKPGAKAWFFPTDNRGAIAYEIDRAEGQPSLADLTAAGLRLVDNKDGFFMMVEGGNIDKLCHIHDTASALRDVLALDAAIAQAYKFYQAHPQETLIIVTADHETGGMTLGTSSGKGEFKPERLALQKISGNKFLGKLAAWRTAKAPFVDALPDIKATFGFADLAPADMKSLEDAYALSMVEPKERVKDDPKFAPYSGQEPLAWACLNLVSNQAGIGWTTLSHTALPAPTSALGVGQELFNGCYDNTDIFAKMVKVMGLKVEEKTAVEAK